MNLHAVGLPRIALTPLLCVGIVLAACGGESVTQTEPSVTSSTAPSATSTTAPSATSTAARPTPTARPGGSTATPTSTRNSGLGGSLSDLKSYRYVLKMEGTAGFVAELSGSSLPAGMDPVTGTLAFEIKGSYVKPDRGEVTITYGKQTLKKVTIGKQQWTTLDGAAQPPRTLSSPSAEDYSYVSFTWDEADPLKDFSCASSRQVVNGLSTRKCSADRSTIERLNSSGELFAGVQLEIQQLTTATAELWVTDDDKVVRARLNLAGTDSSKRNLVFKMELDISDINANLTIAAPG